MKFEELDDLKDKIVAHLILAGLASIERLSRLVGSPEYNVLVALRSLMEEKLVQALSGGLWMVVGEHRKKSSKP